MRNIHTLPTHKSSRLVRNDLGMAINENYHKSILDLIQAKFINIYITNDEEIKDGDWCLDIISNYLYKANITPKTNWENQKKIILTTDQDLIKDGVQAIDDEFLEWFVKNPSCENVEVKDYMKKVGTETDANGYREMDVLKTMYKIIIPKEEWLSPMQELKLKEEPKQQCEHIKEYGCIKDICTCNKVKQETIEEVAEREAEARYPVSTHRNPNDSPYKGIKKTFIHGVTFGYNLAQQQNKNLYSEEDMVNFAYDYMEERKNKGARALTPELLIKQFKK